MLWHKTDKPLQTLSCDSSSVNPLGSPSGFTTGTVSCITCTSKHLMGRFINYMYMYMYILICILQENNVHSLLQRLFVFCLFQLQSLFCEEKREKHEGEREREREWYKYMYMYSRMMFRCCLLSSLESVRSWRCFSASISTFNLVRFSIAWSCNLWEYVKEHNIHLYASGSPTTCTYNTSENHVP